MIPIPDCLSYTSSLLNHDGWSLSISRVAGVVLVLQCRVRDLYLSVLSCYMSLVLSNLARRQAN